MIALLWRSCRHCPLFVACACRCRCGVEQSGLRALCCLCRGGASIAFPRTLNARGELCFAGEVADDACSISMNARVTGADRDVASNPVAPGVWCAACVLRLRTSQTRTANKTTQPTAPTLRLGRALCRFVYRKHFGFKKIGACGARMPISDHSGAVYGKMTHVDTNTILCILYNYLSESPNEGGPGCHN